MKTPRFPLNRLADVALAGLLVMVMASPVLFSSPASADSHPVDLGTTAETFGVLAGTTVTNTGLTVVSGEVGVSPGTAVTGFSPTTGIVINGNVHSNDALAIQAQSDLTIAYDDASGRAPTTTYTVPTDLGGLELVAGVYKSPSSFAITGTLTLDGQSDPNAVFIFQMPASTLTTATDSVVLLINGAQACNVFWQVGSSAELGVRSDFVGTVLALTSITASSGATVDGRLLARNGATTLDTNVVTKPPCDVIDPPDDGSSTSSSSSSSSSSTSSSSSMSSSSSSSSTTTSSSSSPSSSSSSSTTTSTIGGGDGNTTSSTGLGDDGGDSTTSSTEPGNDGVGGDNTTSSTERGGNGGSDAGTGGGSDLSEGAPGGPADGGQPGGGNSGGEAAGGSDARGRSDAGGGSDTRTGQDVGGSSGRDGTAVGGAPGTATQGENGTAALGESGTRTGAEGPDGVLPRTGSPIGSSLLLAGAALVLGMLAFRLGRGSRWRTS